MCQADSDYLDSEAGPSTSLSGPAPKKSKRACKWQEEWKQYNMRASKRGPSFVHCTVCSLDYSVVSGGIHQVKRLRVRVSC